LTAGAVGSICAAMATLSPGELLEHLGETPPDTYPLEIVTEMISRLDEVVPALLRELELAGEDAEFHDEGNRWLRLAFSAYLLAQARETRAYPLLVKLLTLSEKEASNLWGDMITASSPACSMATTLICAP
jgi:hypothetical protein